MNPIQNTVPAVTLRDVLLIVWRRLWVVVLVLGVSLGTSYYISKKTPKMWKASAQMILIQRAMTTSSTPQNAPIVDNTETQIAMIQSYAMARRTVDWLKNDALSKGQSTDSVNLDPESLQKDITVTSPKETSFFNVDVEADSRDKSVNLANAVCQAFVQWKKEVAQQNGAESTGNLEIRVNRARAQMIQAERLDTEYKQKHQLADVPAQHRAGIEQYLTRQTEVTTLKQDLLTQKARIESIGKRLEEANYSVKQSKDYRDDALISSLQQQLSSLEIERANMALKFTAAYPGMLNDQDARIQDVKNRLAKAVQGTLDLKKPTLQVQGALLEDYRQAQTALLFTKAKLDGAVQVRNQLKSEMAAMPKQDMEYARLARNAELARSLFTSLQAALNTARIDKDISGGNVQIAQYAYAPEQPFRPNHTRDMLFGSAIGLFLSLIAVLLMEQSDRRVRNMDTVRRLVSGPIIGAMPSMSRGQMRKLLRGDSPPGSQEAYSLARANLSLVYKNLVQEDLWQNKIILITSAVPGEGKSLTSAELARSVARSGKSVVLVDADMRRPSQNKLFNTAEPLGLADVLTGKNTLEETVVASDTDNLLILHSGRPERNPTELISLPQMAEILEALRSEADVVIVDTPACSVVADALILAPYADCILHVVGAGRVDEGIVMETTTALNASGTRGMVYFVNRVPRERNHAYKYYYANSGALSKKN